MKQVKRLLTGAGCKLSALAFMMLTGTMCASARVVDEALIWWRGINDANGDGFVSADEIVNARFPKNDSAHQGVTISGSGTLRVVEEDVVSPWNGNTNRTPVLRLSNDGTETLIAFPVSKTTLSNSIYALTLHIRCKWDGDFGPDTWQRACLCSYGNGWNEYRGSTLSFIPVAGTSGGIRFDNGRHQGPITDGSLVVQSNVWYDVFFRLEDPNPASDAGSHNLYIDAYFFGAKTNYLVKSISSMWPSWRAPNSNYQSAELKTTDAVRFGNHFKGYVAQFGFWDRRLSLEEMREVAAMPERFPDMVRIGDADGRGDEFAANNAYATNTIAIPGGRLDRVPAVLTAEFPTLNIAFRENGVAAHGNRDDLATITGYETFPQLLTVSTVTGSERCSVNVRLDGTLLAQRSISPGRPAQVYIDPMSIGDHLLSITRVGSVDVHLDQVRVGGSWCLGDRYYSVWRHGNQYAGNYTPYPLELDTPHENMCGNVASSAASTTSSFSFDMPADMTGYAFRYDARISQCKDDKAPNLILYVNGEEYLRHQMRWAWDYFDYTFPPDTFHAGRNTIAWRFDADSHVSGYWAGMRGHVMTLASKPKFSGTFLTIR